MLVFLDEAGDPGFKFDKSSSIFFVVGLVMFEDEDEALACDQRIDLLRKELGLKTNYEFHYKKDSDRIREQFIAAIAPYNFFYYGIVINKQLLWSPNMQIKESFYKYICGLVFENAKDKLTIAQRPSDFAVFETAKDIRDEENEQDEFNKSIYNQYRHLYIIKEKESGKVPYIRPKRRELIKRVQTGQVKGIISYSPDRQARNMLEGGEIITLVDEGQVDLKYTNFHFENNASGKMMLGFWFVFAKQYSDNISESIARGNRGTMERGKHMGDYKRGYIRDEKSGYLIPDGQNFVLMKEAFQKRLREGWSNEKICDWLNKSGFNKKRKGTDKADPKTVYKVWKDPIYYGIYIRGDMRQDLRETNPNFVPMITEDEYTELQLILEENGRKSKLNKENEEKESLMPLDDGAVITDDGSMLTRNIPNLNRHQKKIGRMESKSSRSYLGRYYGASSN